MSNRLKEPSAGASETLAALRRAVKNSLDRKQRLGQFAVIWRDEKPALQDDAAEDHALFLQDLQRVAAHESSTAEDKEIYRPDNE